MILLTGAAGKTGEHILKSLSKRGARVRCLVRNETQAAVVKALGCAETILGDLKDDQALERAVSGVSRVYFIAPNMFLDELKTAQTTIRLAEANQVKRFVYHSVLHPQIEAMPHHWQKMRVEESLFASDLNFSILQPCAYMQNILGGWQSILKGTYSVPYRLNARIAIVDLQDVAEAVTNVLLDAGHDYAIYELAGPENLTQLEVAEKLSKAISKPVTAMEESREAWAARMDKGGMPAYQIELLLKMFSYYNHYGLVGNSSTLGRLLQREPATFSDFLQRISASGE